MLKDKFMKHRLNTGKNQDKNESSADEYDAEED